MKFANTGIRVIDMVDAAEDYGASPEGGPMQSRMHFYLRIMFTRHTD